MAIDAEDILVCLWRFLRFFVNISNNCAQKYPFVSCTLLLFFLVYVFFNTLVYHFPFLICVAVLLRFFWTSERLTIQDVKEEKEKAKEKEKENQRKPLNISRSVDDASKNCESPTLRRQKSRRTRVKPKETSNVEWNNFELVGKEEKELLFPLSIDKRSWPFENGETSSTHDNIFQADEQHTAATDCRISKLDEHLLPCDGIEAESRKSDGNGAVLAPDNGEDIAEDEEEEEAHEGVNNKAVEWTEDDQKNLVDLGLSEIERNRRLESLIAKRRARKLIKNQLEKSLIDLESVPPSGSGTNQIPAPIFVARSNPFEAPNVINEVDGLQVPGSAPSVLLPTQNPFDLPYDPLEEKPNLMGDSFTQEFTAVNQKEMMFCRHESFAFGPFQFDTEQDRCDNKFSSFFSSEKRAFDGLGYSRFRKQSDHDRLIEQLFGVGKSHIDHTPPIVQSGPQSAFQVSNAEMSNIEGGAETKNDMISEEEILNDMESANQMDSISTITEVDTEPSGVEDSETTSSSSFEVANRAEVSISLEPTHRYVEDNMFSCSIPIEPRYDSSPTANDKSSMDDDSSFLGEKRVIHTPSYSIASDLQVEVSEVSSPPLTIGNISPTDCDSLSYDEENFDGTSYDDLEEMETKLRGFSSSDALASENQETTMQLAEKLAAHPFFEVLSKTTEKSSSPLDESLEQNTNVSESVDNTIDNIANEKKHEEGDEGEQILTGQEIVENRAEPAQETESNAYSEGHSENLAEYLSMESAQQIKGNEDLDHKGDSETQSEQESIADEPKSRESEDDSITVDERKNEQSLVESEVPYINQKYEETCSSAEHQESIVEDEVLVNSSSPSSPTAAMIEQAPVDEVSSSNLDQIRQGIDLPKLDTEEELQRSSQEEQPPDGPILIMPQNTTLQEPSASEKFTDKANTDIISNISEPVTEDKSGIEKSEINKDTEEVLETRFNPGVDEELSERPKKTGSRSNETIQNVLEELAEKSSSLSDESTEQNPVYDVRDSASDIIDETADQEKHGDGGGQILIRQEIVENMPEPAEETELQFNARSTDDADLNLKGDSETQTEQESTTDASNSIKAKDNSTTIEERKDEQSLVESEVSCLNQNYEEAELQELKIEDKVLVDTSSSLSPTAATIEQIPVDEVFSSNPPKFDMEDVMQSSSQEEQPPELTSCLSNISNSEILQVGDYETEPSASENFINDASTDAISNINEAVTEDKPGIEKSESTKDINKEEEEEEEESLFNPEVAEELSKPSAKTDSRSNENMEKNLAEELANSPSKDSEEGS